MPWQRLRYAVLGKLRLLKAQLPRCKKRSRSTPWLNIPINMHAHKFFSVWPFRAAAKALDEQIWNRLLQLTMLPPRATKATHFLCKWRQHDSPETIALVNL